MSNKKLEQEIICVSVKRIQIHPDIAAVISGFPRCLRQVDISEVSDEFIKKFILVNPVLVTRKKENYLAISGFFLLSEARKRNLGNIQVRVINESKPENVREIFYTGELLTVIAAPHRSASLLHLFNLFNFNHEYMHTVLRESAPSSMVATSRLTGETRSAIRHQIERGYYPRG